MTRLDQHIDAVRTRFLVQKLLAYLAWTLIGSASALLLLTLAARLFAIELPPRPLLLAGAALLSLLLAFILALANSPSREATALRIDQVLGLKERFSTALQSRNDPHPFAQAAVTDAQALADKVSIHKRFPFQIPPASRYAFSAIALFALTDCFLPQMDLLGKKESQRQAKVLEQRRESAEKALREALAEVMSVPRVGAEEKNLQAARREIEAMLNQEIKDPSQAARTAQNALKEAENARKKVEDLQRYADAQTQKEAFKSLASTPGDNALAEAKKSLADGKFDDAAVKLKSAIATFNNADPAQQARMAGDMQNLAEQISRLAQDPALQQRIQKELEKQGASREQAQQMAQEMAKAAAGDRNAQQRVQNMAENLARRANGGLLPAPAQLAPLMQQVQQMQNQMNSQARAQDLSQAVNQLASAMQQQAAQNQANPQNQSPAQQGQKQAGQQGSGQKQSQGQQASQQGSNQSQQSSAKSPSQQNAQGSQQPGQQGGQGTQDAQQSMEAALAQLEAMQQAAEAGQASSSGQQQGNGEGEGNGWGDGQGQQANQAGQGQGEPAPSGPNPGGIGSGPRPKGTPAPYTVKKEVSPGESDKAGRVIASWMVKADSVKGESKEQFRQVLISQQRDQTDDVEQNRVPMRAQKAVKDYFQSLQDEAK